jgi:lipopolysaccharide export LptBFGC system permease protein LptF
MPIIWHYITKTYLKIFSLSLLTLFGLSFLIKHKKLTLLILAGATYKQAFLLTLCLLSITLPHAIGICSLISSLLTVYKLKSTGEITSLRSMGLSLSRIFAPLYFAGAFLLIVNLFLVSEFVPYTKLVLNKIHLESKAINPLVLLRKNHLPLVSNIYTEMNLSANGSEAKNVLIAHRMSNEKQITLLLAEDLTYLEKTLEGKKVTLITHIPSDTDSFNHLFIDNQSQISTPDSFFASLLKRSSKVKDYEVFSLQALVDTPGPKANTELLQRISKIFYPFTFTLLGLSAPLLTKKRNALFLTLSLFGYFAIYFSLRKASLPLPIATALMLLPHVLITFFSLLQQRKVLRGDT